MNNLKNILKLVITIGIFVFLFRYVDVQQLLAILAKSHGGYLLIACLFQLSSTSLAAYRWQLIMCRLVFDEPLSFYVKSYFKGTFFNQVLPGSIGGDAVRIIELSRMGYNKKDAFYGIFVDRVIGVLGLLVLNGIANLAFPDIFPPWLFKLINILTLCGFCGFILLMNLNRIELLSRYKFIDLFYRLANRLNRLYDTKTLLAKHVAISVIVHLFSVLAIFSIALSVNVHVNLQTFLIAIPPIFLLMIVPISLAGWGVRDGAMVGILMLVGADRTGVLAVSILYGILLIISSLPGAYFWVQRKNQLAGKS